MTVGAGQGQSRAVRQVRSGLDGAALAFGRAAHFFGRVVRGGFPRRIRPYVDEVFRQANILAAGSIMIVLAMVFAFGLGVGIQASYGARLVGAPSASGAFTALANLREVVPLAFGYMLAAKVSTGFVAEIGTMRIREEIDALDAMGLNSLIYLCSTRLLATWLILPFVYGLAIIVAYVASFIAVVVQIGQTSAGGYLELFWKFQSVSDFMSSGVKAMLISTFVVLVGVYYGYTVRGGSVEVGTATAKAMVVNLIGIHVIAILTTQAFWGGVPGLPIGG